MAQKKKSSKKSVSKKTAQKKPITKRHASKKVKHRKGFFKGKYNAYLLTAYTSYRKSTEAVNNKDLAKELGISVASLQTYKKGGRQHSKKMIEVKKQIEKNLSRGGKLTHKGKILYRAVKQLRKKYPNIKKIKDLTIKQINNIKLKVTESEDFLKDLYEAFYEGEN